MAVTAGCLSLPSPRVSWLDVAQTLKITAATDLSVDRDRPTDGRPTDRPIYRPTDRPTNPPSVDASTQLVCIKVADNVIHFWRSTPASASIYTFGRDSSSEYRLSQDEALAERVYYSCPWCGGEISGRPLYTLHQQINLSKPKVQHRTEYFC